MNDLLLYGGFIAFVLLMLFIDLKFFHSDPKETRSKDAAVWVGVWIALAVAFGVIVYFWQGPTKAAEYFAGYLIEYSLSVDNLFLFILFFNYFRVPPEFRHRVLFFGILGAIVFRALFIAAGTALINNFEWVIYIFGAFLVFTAFRIARGTEDVDPEDNPVLKLFQKRFRTTTRFDGQKLFTMENGKRVGTPLLIVLVVIETTDIVFAIDSIPAIFAITRDPFIVLTSNVFAILGLRALYFLLAGTIAKFHLLKYGLAVILGFVGIKMLLTEYWHPPVIVSLGVIVVTLAVTAIASLRVSAPEDQAPGEPR